MSHGTQKAAEWKCTGSSFPQNSLCKQLPNGSKVWTTMKRIWHIPFNSYSKFIKTNNTLLYKIHLKNTITYNKLTG